MPKEQQAGIIRGETIKSIRYSKPGLFRDTGISPTYKPAYSYLPKTQQAEIIRSEMVTGRKAGIELFRPTGKTPSYDSQYLHLSQSQRSQALKKLYLASRQTPMQAFISSEKGQFLPISQRQRLHPQQLKPSLKYPFQEESAPIQDYIKTWKPIKTKDIVKFRAAGIPMGRFRYVSIIGQRVKPQSIQATTQLTRQIQRPAMMSLQYQVLGTGLLSGQGLRQRQMQIQRQMQTQIQIQRQAQIQKQRPRPEITRWPREPFIPKIKIPKIPSSLKDRIRMKSRKGKFGFDKFVEIAKIASVKQVMKGFYMGRRRKKVW